MVQKLTKKLWLLLCCSQAACTFNFELTSQRTALENQVLGSYKEIEDELILVSPVRSESKDTTPKNPPSEAAKAKMNQDFNRDDIEELKNLGILGETFDGILAFAEQGTKADSIKTKLARDLIIEENSDRGRIWAHIIATNPNLSPKDLPNVRLTYGKMIRERSPPGHYFLTENKTWTKK